MRRRSRSSSSTRPAWIVFPRPTPSAKQQADPRHGEGTDHRLKLVRMHLNRRVPHAEDRLVADVVRLPQPVQPGPAVGVDERLQGQRAVRVVRIHAGQRRRSEDLGRGLDLPEHLLGLGVAAVVEILDLDDVQPSLLATGVIRLDGSHRRQSVANLDRLPHFGESRFGCRHRHPPAFL